MELQVSQMLSIFSFQIVSTMFESSRSEARSVHVHILVKCHADRMSK